MGIQAPAPLEELASPGAPPAPPPEELPLDDEALLDDELLLDEELAPASSKHWLPMQTSFPGQRPHAMTPPQPLGTVPQVSPAGQPLRGVQPH